MLRELSVSEQKLAYEFVKRLVLSQDSDFIKVAPSETLDIEEAENEYKNEEYIKY